MGLGRLAHGDKRPVRAVPFHIEQLKKELSLDKKIVPVVQYKDEQTKDKE